VELRSGVGQGRGVGNVGRRCDPAADAVDSDGVGDDFDDLGDCGGDVDNVFGVHGAGSGVESR
jgi:hypothetical protein